MKKTLFALLLATLAAGPAMAEGEMAGGKEAGSAEAAPAGMGLGAGRSLEQMRATQEQRFRNIDSDRDGFVTRAEAENHRRLTSNWEKADANADGRLDAAEFSAFEEIVPPGPPR